MSNESNLLWKLCRFLFFLALTSSLGWLIYVDVIRTLQDGHAQYLARRSLRNMECVVDTKYGLEYRVEFTQGEDSNEAKCVYGDREYYDRDYNKSRLIGEFVGSRTKEAAKGLFDGLMNPSNKHVKEEDELPVALEKAE